DARIIHERIDPIERRNRLLHDRFAIFCRSQFQGHKAGLQTKSPKLILKPLTCRCVTVHGNRDRFFLRAGPCDRGANALRATRYEHNFIFELKIHAEAQSSSRPSTLANHELSREESENLRRWDSPTQ